MITQDLNLRNLAIHDIQLLILTVTLDQPSTETSSLYSVCNVWETAQSSLRQLFTYQSHQCSGLPHLQNQKQAWGHIVLYSVVRSKPLVHLASLVSFELHAMFLLLLIYLDNSPVVETLKSLFLTITSYLQPRFSNAVCLDVQMA